MKNLNFFCAALMLLVSMNCVAANYITLGDEVRIHPRYLDGYFKTNAVMHIEGMCDDWQMAVTYPQSLSVKLVSGITPLSGMTLTYSDNNGKLIRYDAPLTVSAAYANISSHISVTGWDFDEFGNYMPYGSVKWMPGDYEMFELNLYVDPRYRDGNITFDGVLSSGYDTRGAVLQGVRFVRSTRFWVGYLPGDVTGNDKLSIDDVTALIDYLLTGDGLDEFGEVAADANEDGATTILDVTTIINRLLTE